MCTPNFQTTCRQGTIYAEQPSILKSRCAKLQITIMADDKYDDDDDDDSYDYDDDNDGQSPSNLKCEKVFI